MVLRVITSVSLVSLVAGMAVACGSGAGGGFDVADSGTATGGKDAGSTTKPGDSGSTSPPADSGAATSTGPSKAPYTVSGNKILGADGKQHLFRGLDRPSLEWSPNGNGNLNQLDYQVMQGDWNANVVRISLNQDFWLSDSPIYDSTYAETVDQQVQWAETAGPTMDVILDLHWSDMGSYSVAQSCVTSTNGCQQVMADAHSVTFWQQVAAKYANDPHVLFELYNEPHIGSASPQASDWAIWLNGGSTSGFTAVGMQQLYNAVRGVAPNNLVIIGGLDWSYDLSGVSSHMVSGTNIIYNTHPYRDTNANSDAPSQWDAKFGNLAATVPVISTEFGDRSGSCATDYYSSFISYADQKGLSWTAWAFYVASNPCTFPTLLMDSNYTPNAAGAVVQSSLLAFKQPQ